mgnify:CR=1 FL=1
MMRYFAITTLAFGVLTISEATHAADRCEEGLRTGAPHWPPYTIREGEGDPKGIDPEILQEISKITGCKIVFKDIPWKRTLRFIEKGKVDLTYQASINEKRSKYASFSDSYLPYSAILWKFSSDENTYQSLEDFFQSGKNLGITRGYSYGDEADSLIEKNKKQVSENNELLLNIRMTSAERIDGFLGNEFSTSYTAKQNNLLKNLTPTSVIVQSTPVHYMFSEKSVSEETIKKFNKAIVRLKEKGKIDEIVKKYTQN